MKKQIFRQREVTLEVDIDKTIKVTAKGYSKQAVAVSVPGENSQKFTMDGTVMPILEVDKKNLSGEITVSVSTYDVLSIKKGLFGVKVTELASM